ncbi:MAG TPA: CsgG/HfaB family protein [Myxococcota bacterium]|nr:CsgG/HfaB family protein [Myxococcota bacterium]
MSARVAALGLLGALLCPLSAWALPADIELAFLAPPRNPMPGVTSLGVIGIGGFQGRAMEDAIVTALVDRNRGLPSGTRLLDDGSIKAWPNFYPVVERARLAAVINEQELGQSGLVDDGARASLGQLMGAGLLLTGTVGQPTFEEEWTTTTTTVVKDGTSYQVVLQCLDRTVHVGFAARTIDATTGQIAQAPSYRRDLGDRACKPSRGDAEAAVASVDALALRAFPGLALAAANDIAPYWRLTKLDADRNKSTSEGLDVFRKENDLVGAAGWFLAQSEANAYDEWVRFHAAVFLTATLHFEEAHAHLDAARAINPRPVYAHFADTLSRLESDFQVLRSLGVPVEPLVLRPTTRALDAVTVKGSKAVPVVGAPGGAEVVVQVPGGMTLTVVQREGEWIEVRTFDGKQGWIAASAVR